jgi:O-methyltransferase
MRVFFLILNTVWRLLVFVFSGNGKHVGVGPAGRSVLAWALLRNFVSLRGRSASTPAEQLVLVNAALGLDPKTPGALAEFGCFKGVASCALSLVARRIGRRFIIFDSFEGLPAPTQEVHNIAGRVPYRQGDFTGTLHEVQQTIARFGAPEVVEYVQGYFSATLPARTSDQFALIFEDADLVESVRDVLVHTWKRLSDGGIFFCHEARDREVIELFYDRSLWQTIGADHPPGLIGAGVGLPLDPRTWRDAPLEGAVSFRGSCLGYVVKQPA